MKTYIYEAKNFEEAKEKAIKDQNVLAENLDIKIIEEKQGLLKKITKIEVININELINEIKESIKKITNLMNIETNIEVRKRDKTIELKLFSNNNAILIGKDGKNLKALQNIIKQAYEVNLNNEYKILLDIENYKEKKIMNLERVAKKVAKEVARTKIETKLEKMNSYERMIIHNTLSNNKYVYTESTGEEPNRYVVIKPKEEK